MSRIGALILSGGASTRMGSFKPLLPLGESTVIEENINNFKKTNIEDILVVVGSNGEELGEKIKKVGVNWVINKEYNKGMFSSLKVGARKIENDSFFLNLVDTPLVRPNTIEKIVNCFNEYNPMAVVPTYKGEMGHPILISKSLKKLILEYENPKEGLRTILKEFQDETIFLKVPDGGIIKDMDTFEEYNDLKEMFLKRNIPSYEESLEILFLEKTSLNIINHSKKVMNLSLYISQELKEKGIFLDEGLLKAASLLHDIGKGSRSHNIIGASIVRGYGYENVAELVKSHMDITINFPVNFMEKFKIKEEHILFLSDKLVKEDKFVSLEERFKGGLERYRENAEALRGINKRKSDAIFIKKYLENIIEKEIKEPLNF